MVGRAARSRPGRVTAQAIILAAALAAPPSLFAQQDTLYSTLALEAAIERGPSRLVLALARDSTVLVPVLQLLDLAEVRILGVFGRRVEGVLNPGSQRLVFDADSLLAVRGSERRALAPPAVLWRAGELYLATDVLGWALGVELTVSWTELTLRVAGSLHLPAVQRLARERRRIALTGAASLAAAPARELPVPRRAADGYVLDWSISSSTREPLGDNAVALGFGAAVLGGSLEVQNTIRTFSCARPGYFTPRTCTEGDTRWSWVTAWPGRRWLRQVRAGDVVSGGPRGRGVRGAVITNSPFLRPAEFGVERLAGRLQPGWEVELYRGDQLLGYAPVDSVGAFGLDIPVNYGPNPLQLAAYGPKGEVVRRGRTFQIPSDRLPAGRFEYSLGGGECAGLCRYALNADLRFGLTRRITLQAGYDRYWRGVTRTALGGLDTLPDLDHPYALASVALTRAFAVSVEGVANAFSRVRFDLDPHSDFHLDLGYVRFDTTTPSPLIGTSLYTSQSQAALYWRPATLGGDAFVQASATRSEGGTPAERRSSSRQRLSFTARLLGVRLSASGQQSRDRQPLAPAVGRTELSLAADAVVSRPRWLKSTLLRAAGSLDCADLFPHCDPERRRLVLGVGRQLRGALRLDLGLRAERGQRAVLIDVSLATALPGLRASSRNTVRFVCRGAEAPGCPLEPEAAGLQLFEGTILLDRRTGELALGSGRNLGRGGVAGLVFLDHDGDGVRDADEEGLPEVLLRVGSASVATDSLGQFAVWDLVPFEPAPVEVDSLALPNPLWVPTAARATVRPSPNSFQFVEVAIEEGGEVSGLILLDGVPLPAVRLVLTRLATGAAREVTSFADGSFYALGLLAGEYEAAVDSALLERLGASAEPTRFLVGRRGREARLEGVEVRLRRE